MDSQELKIYMGEKIHSEINIGDVFYFDSKNIKAVAVRNGIRCSCINDIKEKIKELGFRYSYIFDAYIKKEDDYVYSEYRSDKNQLLDKLIKWKVLTTKKSKNEQKDFGRLIYHQV